MPNTSKDGARPVAVITGASRGIGAATARELAALGYDLVLASRSAADMDLLARELEAKGGRSLVVPTDVRRREDLRRLAEAALDRFGHVDVLLNNAGVVNPGILVSQITDDQAAAIIETNLIASIELTRALLPAMIARRQGFIGFVDSVGGHIAIPSAALYSTTKFALRGFAGALRREVMADGVKVSVISPGFIATRLTEDVQHIFGRLKIPMGTPEQVAKVIVRTILRPRREVIYPAYYRLFAWLERNLPLVMDFTASQYLRHVLPKHEARLRAQHEDARMNADIGE